METPRGLCWKRLTNASFYSYIPFQSEIASYCYKNRPDGQSQLQKSKTIEYFGMIFWAASFKFEKQQQQQQLLTFSGPRKLKRDNFEIFVRVSFSTLLIHYFS